MNVGELLEMIEHLDPEIEIRIAYQPNYPLRATLRDVVEPAGLADVLEPEDEDEEADWDPEAKSQEETEGFLWLVTGDGISYNENPYASRDLWANSGW